MTRITSDIGHLGQGIAGFDAFALVEELGYLEGGAFAHAVVEQVGRGVGENTGKQTVVPIVVVRQTTHGGFDTSNNHRGIGIELLEDTRVYVCGAVRAETCLPARCVSIIVTQTAGSGVVIDHTVHYTTIDPEKEAWSPELAEIAQVVAPVGLRNNSHTIASCLKRTPNNGCTKGRMVNVSIACDQNDVDLLPSKALDLI